MQQGAIKSEQQKIFKELHKFSGCYLAGGTGLALQMGHRVSIDFDLFFPNGLPNGLLAKVRYIFKDNKIEVFVRHSEQLSVKVNGIRIDFVQYKFLLALDFVMIEKVPVASILEIAAMKAYALNFRGTFKDYVDLYFILKRKLATLSDIQKVADKKFGNNFNFRLFLEQLVDLWDIKAEQQKDIEFLGETVDKDIMQKFFKQEVKKVKI
ncbi:MAG: nucleotidyl transferase AbiEii/AbiGii toxin family protein [Patescibacteria group bacterium]|nr:nucleotidyl transferase AbiEii/AbiGii toxin family protein [Patescibacteria group bacterium]